MGLGPHHSVAKVVEGPPRLVQETKAGAGRCCCVISAAVYLKMSRALLRIFHRIHDFVNAMNFECKCTNTLPQPNERGRLSDWYIDMGGHVVGAKAGGKRR